MKTTIDAIGYIAIPAVAANSQEDDVLYIQNRTQLPLGVDKARPYRMGLVDGYQDPMPTDRLYEVRYSVPSDDATSLGATNPSSIVRYDFYNDNAELTRMVVVMKVADQWREETVWLHKPNRFIKSIRPV